MIEQLGELFPSAGQARGDSEANGGTQPFRKTMWVKKPDHRFFTHNFSPLRAQRRCSASVAKSAAERFTTAVLRCVR